MAGTNSKQNNEATAENAGPAVILVEPQLGENIGMAARAMLNCGLTDLRLVAPRDGWPSDTARAAAAGADLVIDGAQLFDTAAAAIADLNLVFATTARPRDMTKRVVDPNTAAEDLCRAALSGSRTGVLFGKESKGLTNDDLALTDAVIQAPLNPAFSSLNLAQAVFLIAYQWRLASLEKSGDGGQLAMPKDTRPANKAEMVGLFEHLEQELTECRFLYPPERVPVMSRNLRNMFGRADLTEQEVRTLRGVIASLRRGPPDN